jgi:hypothetical protein
MDNIEFSIDNYGFPLGVQVYSETKDTSIDIEEKPIENITIETSTRIKSMPYQLYGSEHKD